MIAETIEHVTGQQPLDETRITLEVANSAWKRRAECSDASLTEMGYDQDGYESRGVLSYTEKTALHGYCAPCPVQETCLAWALLTGDTKDGMIGGLTPYARKKLQSHFDSETASIPRRIWNLANEAVLEERVPDFALTNRSLKMRMRILDFLGSQPDGIYSPPPEHQGSFFNFLAAEVELSTNSARVTVNLLAEENRISTILRGKRVAAIGLAA